MMYLGTIQISLCFASFLTDHRNQKISRGIMMQMWPLHMYYPEYHHLLNLYVTISPDVIGFEKCPKNRTTLDMKWCSLWKSKWWSQFPRCPTMHGSARGLTNFNVLISKIRTTTEASWRRSPLCLLITWSLVLSHRLKDKSLSSSSNVITMLDP